MSTFSVHMGYSVTGPLRNWTKADWKRNARGFTRDDGTKMTGDELKDEFLRMLAQGIEVFPLGKCPNWDNKHGCRCHDAAKGAAK